MAHCCSPAKCEGKEKSAQEASDVQTTNKEQNNKHSTKLIVG